MQPTRSLIVLALLLASCTSTRHRAARPAIPGELTVRTSAGVHAATVKLETATTFLGQTFLVTEKADVEIATGRVELVTPTRTGPDVGFYLGGGLAGGDADFETVSLGATVRHRFNPPGWSGVSPFVEVHGGAVNAYVGDVSGIGYEVGGALGVEFATGERSSIHVQVGYDLTDVGLDVGSIQGDGFALMVGGSFRL